MAHGRRERERERAREKGRRWAGWLLGLQAGGKCSRVAQVGKAALGKATSPTKFVRLIRKAASDKNKSAKRERDREKGKGKERGERQREEGEAERGRAQEK